MEQLEEKIDELSDKIIRLSVSKLSDPRYPYFNWLLNSNISNDESSLLEGIMAALSYRLEGREVPDQFKKEVPGVSMQILYADARPDYKEAKEIITAAIDIDAEIIPNMLKVMYGQGKFKELCEHLLAEIGIEPWQDDM